MSNIFSPAELKALVGPSQLKLEDRLEGERKAGIRSAFESIKQDYEVHDAIMGMFGEAEGFALKLPSASVPGVDPSYLGINQDSIQYKHPVLIAKRNRNNYIVLGKWDSYSNTIKTNEGVGIPIEISVPDTNFRKILEQMSKGEFANPENFALLYLASRANTELGLQRNVEIPDGLKNRTWERDYSRDSNILVTPIHFKSKLAGEDLIAFYKEGVNAAAGYARRIDRKNDRIYDPALYDGKIKLFNRDMYSTKGIPTRIHSFELKAMNL